MLKTTPFQIVIASDNRLIADGIAAHLRHAPDIDICARAADGQSVIDACLNYKPDALLLNPELPGKSSQEITRHLTESLPQTRIILVTGSDNHLETVRLFQAGAVACIHTDTMIDLVDTIRTVMQGQSIMPDFVLETLLSHSARPRPAPPPASSITTELTDRETVILRELVNGYSNKQIARHLDISTSTVKAHLSSIYRKLNVSTRTQVVSMMSGRNLLELPVD